MSHVLETIFSSLGASGEELEARISKSITFAVEYRLRGMEIDRPVDSLISCYSMFSITARSVILDIILEGLADISDKTPIEDINTLEKAISYRMYVEFDDRVGNKIREGYFEGKGRR